MAFGIKRYELNSWKQSVKNGEIAFLTHYWLDSRFPDCTTVTKVGCADIDKLIKWGEQYGLSTSWIHQDKNFPHYDLFGDRQKQILFSENQINQIRRFNL
ncbi:hypothetical protein [Aquibacillus saliphilus]|uniref:hypothetical protein n=1 Tax=Aquibacillus saliphilus TaxID=1909422 RepID=UPI001CEFCEF1|nr:hypothetical protein [Aquibacillus saliphilus]